MTRHEAATPGPGWTGGQWSLLRVLLSLVVAAIALGLAFDPPAPLPTDQGPAIAVPAFTGEVFFPRLLGAIAAVLAVLLGIGRFDRVSAALLWSLTLLLVLARPDLWSLAAPTLGAVLVIHALAPAAPYGSWEARGRSDPGGGWCLPPALIAVLRWLPTVTLACLGVARLAGVHGVPGGSTGLGPGLLALAELFLAGLLAIRATRHLAWWLALALEVGVLVAAGDAAGAAGIAILFLATFDPGWVPGREVGGAERLFYDGDCGLCHRFVRFALAEDVTGRALRYAPLGGPTFETELPETDRSALPDSIVVKTREGELLVRSRAVYHLGSRLGGLWRFTSALARVVPLPLADLAYDGVARIRHRLFAKPEAACPLVPPHLAKRFDP